jgi:DNA polymerase
MKPKFRQMLQFQKEYDNCTLCDLHKTRTNVVFGEGKLDTKLMFIGEAPGAEEDKLSRVFIGDAGRVLNELLEGIDLNREEVYLANSVCCRPPGNKDPNQEYVEACRKRLTKQIQIVNPKIVCALGKVAAEWFLKTKKPMKERHGKVYKGKRLLFVTYHPAYAVYNPNNFPLLYEDFQKLNKLYRSLK